MTAAISKPRLVDWGLDSNALHVWMMSNVRFAIAVTAYRLVCTVDPDVAQIWAFREFDMAGQKSFRLQK